MSVILLNILKIIGIVLLCILGLIIVLLLLVLFVPIRYRFRGHKHDEDIDLNAKVSWLFNLIRVLFSYPDPGEVTVKVLFFKVFNLSVNNNDYDDGDSGISENVVASDAESPTDTWNNGKNDKSVDKKDEAVSTYEYEKKYNQDVEDRNETSKNDFQDVVDRENDSVEKTESGGKFENFKYTLKEKYDRIKSIFGNLSFYKKLITHEDSVELYEHALKRLKKILKSIRPRVISGNIIYGGKTPDTTGYVYGAYSMFRSIIGKHFVLTPDFTEEALSGDVFIKGRITVFVILINAALVYFDKKCRLFIRRIKRHNERLEKHTEKYT